MQIDVGAPPQFMDFRYRVADHDHGEFWLDHCGALMDVEPMGPDYVVAMCHDIEDPTFEATATASNPKAQVRPVHRPPRVPADRAPHCHWRVTIDESHPELPVPPQALAMADTRAARLGLPAIDPDDPGRHDYAGPLLDDLPFSEWSSSALRRILDEVCLQGHLLALAFLRAVRARTDTDASAVEFGRRQFTGVAGVVAARLRVALGLGPTLATRRVCSPSTRHSSVVPTSVVTSSSVTAWSSASAATRRPRRTGPGRRCSPPTISSPSMPWCRPSTGASGVRRSPTTSRVWWSRW